MGVRSICIIPMKISKEVAFQEWLNRRTSIADDIRFLKEQQWRTLYYTLLSYAAAVSVFQMKVYLPWFVIARTGSVLIVGLIGITVFVHLMALAVDLDLTRLAADNIEERLNNLTGIRDECNEMRYHKWRGYRRARSWFLIRCLPNILTDTHARKSRKRNNVRSRRSRRDGFFYLLYFSPFAAVHIIATVATCIVIGYTIQGQG